VKALTSISFSARQLASNRQWTSSLGEPITPSCRYYVGSAGLRAKALAAGNLNPGQQLSVVQQSPQVMVIHP